MPQQGYPFPTAAYGTVFSETAVAIDAAIDAAERAEKYQRKKMAKHHVATVAEVPDTGESKPFEGDTRLIFWDTLRDFDRETALYCVLHYCMGYCKTEVAYGLGVPYSRVKYLTQKACKMYEAKQ